MKNSVLCKLVEVKRSLTADRKISAHLKFSYRDGFDREKTFEIGWLNDGEPSRFELNAEYPLILIPLSENLAVLNPPTDTLAPVLDRQNPDYPKIGDRFVDDHLVVLRIEKIEDNRVFAASDSLAVQMYFGINDDLINRIKRFKAQNKPHISLESENPFRTVETIAVGDEFVDETLLCRIAGFNLGKKEALYARLSERERTPRWVPVDQSLCDKINALHKCRTTKFT